MKGIIIIVMLLLGGCTPPNNYNGKYTQIISKSLSDRKTTSEHFYVFRSMLFLTENKGFVGGETTDVKAGKDGKDNEYATIYSTNNGGYDWSRIDLCEKGSVDKIKYINDIIYAGVRFHGKRGYKIYVSSDRGSSWHLKSEFKEDIYNFYFRDSLNGIIYNDMQDLYITNNGGDSYEKLSLWDQYAGNDVLDINDSTIVYVSGMQDDIHYLTSLDYVNNKELFRIKIPIVEKYSEIRYSTNTLLLCNENKVYVYDVTSDNQLKLLHTFEFGGKGKTAFNGFISRNENNICIGFNIDLARRFYFSKDYGSTWNEIKYFRYSSLPQYVLYSNDTIMYWRNGYPGLFNFIKINP